MRTACRPISAPARPCSPSVRTLTDQAIIPATAQSSSAAGASWATGLIIVTFPASLTGGLTFIEYHIEIQTYLNARYKTWPLVEVDCLRTTMPR